MPRKKKAEDVTEPDETLTTTYSPTEVESTATTEITDEEMTVEVKEKVFTPTEETKKKSKNDKLPKGMVKCKVLIGTLEFEDGVFSEGETFITTKERAKRFERTSVEILNE